MKNGKMMGMFWVRSSALLPTFYKQHISDAQGNKTTTLVAY